MSPKLRSSRRVVAAAGRLLLRKVASAVRAAGGAGLVLLQAEGADGHGLLGGLLGCGPVMEVNTNSPAVFVNRGGRIPAPLQSLKN